MMTSLSEQRHVNIEENQWFGYADRINSLNCKASTLKLAEEFNHLFAHLFIFGKLFCSGSRFRGYDGHNPEIFI